MRVEESSLSFEEGLFLISPSLKSNLGRGKQRDFQEKKGINQGRSQSLADKSRNEGQQIISKKGFLLLEKLLEKKRGEKKYPVPASRNGKKGRLFGGHSATRSLWERREGEYMARKGTLLCLEHTHFGTTGGGEKSFGQERGGDHDRVKTLVYFLSRKRKVMERGVGFEQEGILRSTTRKLV